MTTHAFKSQVLPASLSIVSETIAATFGSIQNAITRTLIEIFFYPLSECFGRVFEFVMFQFDLETFEDAFGKRIGQPEGDELGDLAVKMRQFAFPVPSFFWSRDTLVPYQAGFSARTLFGRRSIARGDRSVAAPSFGGC